MRSFSQIILTMLAASLSCTWSTVYLQTAKQQADNKNRKDICVKVLQYTQSLIDFQMNMKLLLLNLLEMRKSCSEAHYRQFKESESTRTLN